MVERELVLPDRIHDPTRPALRRPLSDSAQAGNIKHPVLASNSGYDDPKESIQPLGREVQCGGREDPCADYEMGLGVDCPYPSQNQGMDYNYGTLDIYGTGMDSGYGMKRAQHSKFTVPSQNFGRMKRKADGRRRRRRRRNPIAEMEQYQAYRSRQTKGKDQKWNDLLESLFLDALISLPRRMGRRKFSIEGKLHGINELISVYLWIGYCNSLPPGAERDESMRRDRKQVSSHIQVLKKFMENSPHFKELFPDKAEAANGFEESFKDNKTLNALAVGRLPSPDYEDDELIFLEPSSFEMFVSTSENEFHEDVRIHDYSSLANSPFNGSKESIGMVRDKFPELEELRLTGSLPPCVIHLNVSINLMKERPDGAELNTRMFLQANSNSQTSWRTSTTLVKPKCLSGPPDVDAPIYKQIDPADYVPNEDGTIKLHTPFPALPWAHTFIQLIDLLDDTLLETITMYQEIYSRTASDPYIRRAVLLWTFHKSQDTSVGETTWRYVGAPERHQVFSPGIDEPQPHHHSIHSILHEEFSSSWDDQNLQLASTLMDPFTQSFDANQQIPAPVLRSPFNPDFQYVYDSNNDNRRHQQQQNLQHNINHQQQQNALPSTPQHQTCLSLSQNSLGSHSHDQEQGNNTLNMNDSSLTNMNFDSNHGLDIQLSYDAVGVGVGLDDVDFGAKDLGGQRDPWLTPTPGDQHQHQQHQHQHQHQPHHGHFEGHQLNGRLDVDVGDEGWVYEGLGDSVVGVGVGVGGCQWDDGVGVGELGVGRFMNNQGHTVGTG